jgi:hypothetical protein
MRQTQLLRLHLCIHQTFGIVFHPITARTDLWKWIDPLTTAITDGCAANPDTIVHVTLVLREPNQPAVDTMEARVPFYQRIVQMFRNILSTNLWVHIVGVPGYVPRGLAVARMQW